MGLAQPKATDPVTVLIADDDAVARSVLVALVEGDPTLELAALANDAAEAIEAAERPQPDVAILDWSMPAGGGPEAARRGVMRVEGRDYVVADGDVLNIRFNV